MVVRPDQAEQQTASNGAKRSGTERTPLGPGSLSGNVTHDPELRYTPGGRAVVKLRVAVSERVQAGDTGEWKDGPTEFFTVQAWGPLAENIIECVIKGDRITCEGKWQSEKWEDSDGNAQERITLTANDLGPSLLFRHARIERKGRAAR